MRICCQYNPQLDCFLKGLVEYVLDSYGNQLLLDDLEEIELIKDLPGSSDGRVIEGGKKLFCPLAFSLCYLRMRYQNFWKT